MEEVSKGSTFKDLKVWQRAMELSLSTYRFTSSFPPTEHYGLSQQMRRAAVSVASNIAEGYGRSTSGEYLLFLGHARGSLCELEAQILLSRQLVFGPPEEASNLEALCLETSRMLHGLYQAIERKKAS